MIIETKIEDIPFLIQEIKEVEFERPDILFVDPETIRDKKAYHFFQNKDYFILEDKTNEFNGYSRYIKYIELTNIANLEVKCDKECNWNEFMDSLKKWSEDNLIKIVSVTTMDNRGVFKVKCGRVVPDVPFFKFIKEE